MEQPLEAGAWGVGHEGNDDQGISTPRTRQGAAEWLQVALEEPRGVHIGSDRSYDQDEVLVGWRRRSGTSAPNDPLGVSGDTGASSPIGRGVGDARARRRMTLPVLCRHSFRSSLFRVVAVASGFDSPESTTLNSTGASKVPVREQIFYLGVATA